MEISKRCVTAPIYPYVSTENKEVRIRMLLTPILSRGQVRIKDCPQGRLLGNQLRDFPLASHDDGPDALALMVRLWRDLIGMSGQPPAMNQPVYTR